MNVNFKKLHWRDFLKKPLVSIDDDHSSLNIGVRADFAVAVLLLVAVFFFAIAR